MRIDRFEDILAWQKAKHLTENIYEQTKGCKDFGFNNQIQRAAVSVMNNIAEGFERRSNKEFKNFLFITKGSCREVCSMLHVEKTLKYLDDKQFELPYRPSEEISRMISGLIKTL